MITYVPRYSKAVEEIQEIIEGMGLANNLWYKNHKEPASSSLNSRLSSLTLGTMGTCGVDDNNRIAPYSSFVNSLP